MHRNDTINDIVMVYDVKHAQKPKVGSLKDNVFLFYRCTTEKLKGYAFHFVELFDLL